MTKPLRAAALGFFDGVHCGHAAILHQTVRIAREMGLRPTALTFAGHPRALVGGGAPPLLTSRDERSALIQALGVEEVVFLHFDEQMASLPPERFVTDVLLDAYQCGAVVTGENYRFGKGAAGTPRLLREMGERFGFRAVLCPAVMQDGVGISSTRIRAMVEAGEVEYAARLLGRPFALSGEIIHGRHVGRRLGFPTINLLPPDGLALPKAGVYAARVVIGGETWPAVTNIGVRPTFTAEGTVTIESHLLGFHREVYHDTASVHFLRRLRDEEAFASPELLRQQISRDAQNALRAQHEVKL